MRMSYYIRMPLGDIKLYASGKIVGYADSTNSNLGKSIIPAIEGLLSAAEITDYSVFATGELTDDIEYGTIVKNEAVLFRDKLRELSTESATLVKFAPNEKTFWVKSVSRHFNHDVALIPLSAIILENNIYDFKMESPYRNDILNGLLVSWGKNAVTDKYEHSLLVDSNGIYKDGEMWNLRDSILGDKWLPVFEQLGKNRDSNIGTTKSIDGKWIMDWAGTELMAYNYLCWNCAPLRKAQINCIIPALKKLNKPVDIGDFICLDLPGYPPKLAKTTWVITGKHDDLDKMVSALELLEAWNMPVILPDRFLLLENGRNILTEAEQNIKLESSYG